MFETSLLFNSSPNLGHTPEKSWSWEKLRPLGICALFMAGIACVSWGTWLFFKPSDLSQVADIPLLTLDSASSIYVDISGAVHKPGIYPLPEGERVASALQAAGGLADEADADYINTTLNLSARLKDEQKIYVPFKDEGVENQSELSTEPLTAEKSDSLISINSATESELDELPKIGPATAQKIIDGRPYVGIDELVSKKILGEAVFKEIKELIKI